MKSRRGRVPRVFRGPSGVWLVFRGFIVQYSDVFLAYLSGYSSSSLETKAHRYSIVDSLKRTFWIKGIPKGASSSFRWALGIILFHAHSTFMKRSKLPILHQGSLSTLVLFSYADVMTFNECFIEALSLLKAKLQTVLNFTE